MKSLIGVPGLPAGLRNNNPGAILKTATRWQGEIEGPEMWERFSSIPYGLRALYIIIYHDLKKGVTARELMKEYSGASGMVLDNYTAKIETGLNVQPLEKIAPTDTNVLEIARLIAEFENGPSYARNYLSFDDYNKAFALWKNSTLPNQPNPTTQGTSEKKNLIGLALFLMLLR